jgi:biopolymer transport protein ExbB/TolQ
MEQLAMMSRRLRFNKEVVRIAPMLRFFGTVVGSVSVLGELSRSNGAVDPAAMADGVGATLLIMAAGLAIVIPFYFVSVWFDSSIEKKRATIETRIGTVLQSPLPLAHAPAPGAALAPWA